MILPVLRKRIAFSPEAQKFLGGIWTNDETLMMPAYVEVLDGFSGPYAQFLTLKEDEDEPGRWVLLFEDLFESGGADGDCESFDTLGLAIERANEVIRRDGFTVFPLHD